MGRIDKLVEHLRYLKKGGKSPIHIKKENRGKFNALRDRTGKSAS